MIISLSLSYFFVGCFVVSSPTRVSSSLSFFFSFFFSLFFFFSFQTTGTTSKLGKQLDEYFTSPGAHVHAGIPCHILHPGRSCQEQRVWTFQKGFKQAIALYGSLGLTTSLLFNLKRMILQPLNSVWFLATSTVRSAFFLALFPTLYMTTVCLYKINAARLPKMHRFYFWIAGVIGGTSIYIERTSRRFELGMFALPRALQSVGNIIVSNGYLPPWYRLFTLISFSMSMGVIMTAYDVERNLLVPAMRSLLGNFFLSHSKRNVEKEKKMKMKMKNVGKKREKKISGTYLVDQHEYVLAPRIEEVIEYESDAEEEEVVVVVNRGRAV